MCQTYPFSYKKSFFCQLLPNKWELHQWLNLSKVLGLKGSQTAQKRFIENLVHPIFYKFESFLEKILKYLADKYHCTSLSGERTWFDQIYGGIGHCKIMGSQVYTIYVKNTLWKKNIFDSSYHISKNWKDET